MRKLWSAQVSGILKECLRPEIVTFHSAFQRFPQPRATEAAYRHAAGARNRELIQKLFAARRSVARLECQLRLGLAQMGAQAGKEAQ